MEPSFTGPFSCDAHCRLSRWCSCWHHLSHSIPRLLGRCIRAVAFTTVEVFFMCGYFFKQPGLLFSLSSVLYHLSIPAHKHKGDWLVLYREPEPGFYELRVMKEGRMKWDRFASLAPSPRHPSHAAPSTPVISTAEKTRFLRRARGHVSGSWDFRSLHQPLRHWQVTA